LNITHAVQVSELKKLVKSKVDLGMEIGLEIEIIELD